ncbi:DUF1826 domain-containing protein [Microbulbifer spongiae]|uniref:DUF1826 domain-containing protein n=1 Tax=Microbulbifer spongiae TaxID=2944933 RepID=A0ABY9EBE9_9GAMM|nr:DUF1826 domain-containing protein [Microbulbifer sp. MI-G]WKD49276.1 DUF1826 domain-containing protein [Microbulbifer sp. MI-G]
MNAVSAATIAPEPAAVTRRPVAGDSADILADIYQTEVNMAVWQRQTAPELVADIKKLLDLNRFTSERLIVPSAKIDRFEETLPSLAECPHLKADIQRLFDMFSCLFELSAVGMRLTTLKSAMCPRFHVDRVPCRLITTYVGPGTEWLPHDSVDHSKLGAGSGGLSDEDSGLYPRTQPVQTIASGHVALCKGELWQDNLGAGCVHRSPALAAGEQRLLLTLDFSSTD